MSKGTVNKVILIGRLGSDPDIRYTPAGSMLATFSLATNRTWKDKDGNWQESTDWHRVVAWTFLAERVKEYVKKGNRVYIEGRLQTREWEDQNGQKRYTTEVVANDLQLLESLGQRAETAGDESAPPPEMPPPEDIDQTQDDVPF